MAILISFLTFVSTFLGGLVGLRYKDKSHLILGFTAGVLLGVIAFDLLPEIINLITETKVEVILPMLGLVGGFLIFHIIEKSLVIHTAHEQEYGSHHHPPSVLFRPQP